MNIKLRKIIIYIGIFLAILALLFALYIWQNGRKIPSLPATAASNEFLKDQVNAARKKAVCLPSAENIGRLGMIYNSAELYDEAARCYERALIKDPSGWKWSYYLGYLNLELGNSEKAAGSFRKVWKSPAKYLAMYYTGSAWENLNVQDSAVRYFRMSEDAGTESFANGGSRVNYFPLPVYAKYRIAGLYINANISDSAESILKELTWGYAAFGPAWRQLSNIYAIKGDSVLSRYYSSRANDLTIFSPPPDPLIDELSLISRSDTYLMKQADVAIRSANSRWAVDILQHGLQFFSGNKYYLSKAVREFLSVGMSKAASPYIDRHFSFYKDETGELLETARLLADAGLARQAQMYMSRAFQNSMNNPVMQSEIALLCVQKGLKQDGLKLMTELLKSDQEDAKIISNAAFMYVELNDRVNTMKYFDLLERLSPDDVKTKILAAIIAEKGGKRNEAASLYEKAFSNEPKNIYVIDHLSNIYLVEQQWGKAISFLKKALAIYPNSSALQEKLGGLLVACPDPSFRNVSEGKEYSERAFINYNYTLPVRISAGRDLALAYNSLGDNANARLCIRKTLDIAQNANVSKEYMQNLKDLLAEFSK